MSQRKLPLWMLEARKREPLDKSSEKLETACAIATQNVTSLEEEGEPPKRRLRSNYKIESEEKKEPIVQIEYLPFIEYSGAIGYYTTLQDIAFHSNNLLNQLLQQSTDQDIPIAFDLEWPFSFTTGPGRTALMQLCGNTDYCLLLQISCLKRLPPALTELLYHPRVVLHGVNIKNDFRKLARDFPEVNADRLIARCVELGQWYNELNGSTGRWSLARLVEQVLKLRINKDKSVRMSQWNVLPLSYNQKLYAAIDVYIGQRLYLNLAEKQKEKDNVENCMLEEDAATLEQKNISVKLQQVAGVEKLPLTTKNNDLKQYKPDEP
ncbi:3'-5' exonuclease [Anopheles moucheti]|uniref:3'-5' exonuclease n=1 Tax=Anopheles moucheti TaxID=186751 RepID=UPI0022F0EFE1|nr:3'-5' exonuclease [Anopheles moucheti]XP_052900672.1 3'-5' exonuclease [Anopheles moucheti]